MNKMISLCMIVKNEGQFLEGCLESVKDLVSEIIIVDTDSTDNTLEIAKRFGAKVFNFKWTNDFSDARNFSLKHATNPWILVLDADEAIAKEDIAKIKELIQNNNSDGFIFEQRHYTNDSTVLGWRPTDDANSKGCLGYYPIKITRLFRNQKEIKYKGIVHELVDESIREIKGKMLKTGIPIHHYQFLKGESIVKEKQIKYLELSKELVKKNPNAKTYHDMGVIYFNIKQDLDNALECFKKAIELDKGFIQAYLGISMIYRKQGKVEESIEACKKALSIKPDAECYFNLGNSYAKLTKFKDAAEAYKKAIMLNPLHASAYKNLGNVYARLNKLPQAVQVYEKAIALNHKDKEQIKRALEQLKHAVVEPDITYNFKMG